MLNYKQFYLKYGMRKPSDFTNTRVIETEDLTFPLSTIMFWLSPSTNPTGPNDSVPYLTTVKNAVVITETAYLGDTIGNPRINSNFKPNKIVRDLATQAKGWKYVRPGVKDIKLSNKKMLILNTGILNTLYRYTSHPMTDYYRWQNHFNTATTLATNKVTGSNRNKVMAIKVPMTLPTIMDMNLFSKNMTKSGLGKFPTASHLNVLDMWKLLTPELKDDSILGKIPVGETDNITLLLTIDTRVLVLNLGKLLAMVEEYELDSKFTKYKSITVKKMLYIALKRLATNIKPQYLDEDIGDLSDGSEDDNIDIDDIIDNQLPDTETTVDADDTVETVSADQAIENNVDDVNSLEEITKQDRDPAKEVADDIDQLLDNGVISKGKAKAFKDILEEQKKAVIDLPGGKVKLQELLNVSEEELKIDKKETKLPDSKVVFNKDELFDTIKEYESGYIKNTLQKDIASAIYGVQNNNILVQSMEVEREEALTGTLDTYTIKLQPINGKPATVKLKVPVVDEDGEFTLSSNHYKMVKQKVDLPIRKINHAQVALSSYYGKLFVNKAYAKRYDVGYWFSKQILKISEENDKIKDIVMIKAANFDADMPLWYGYVSRYFSSFTIGKDSFSFNYHERYKILGKQEDVERAEVDDMVLIGNRGKTPIVMDANNVMWLKNDNGYTELGTFLTLLDLDLAKAPIEHATIKIFKQHVPIVILLSYYLGFSKLLKLLKVKYALLAPRQRATLEDSYFIDFADTRLEVVRDYGLGDMIIGGMSGKRSNVKLINMDIYDKPNSYSLIFSELGLSVPYVTEIKLLKDMYVDPITLTVLKEIKEPTIFTGLLIRSCELLLDDNYKDPQDASATLIRGYERMPGMMYKIMVDAIKDNANKSVFGTHKLTVKPFALTQMINEDSTTMVVNDNNPIAQIKQNEDISSVGFGGRSKLSMGRGTRGIHPSEIGTISEASKDSGDVGISNYLTSDPQLLTTRGILGNFDMGKQPLSKTVATNTLLMPNSMNDDPKRSNFSNIQASHVIPIIGSKVTPVRTGYEAIIPFRSGSKFIKKAAEDGIVLEVTDSYVKVQYGEDTKAVKIPIKEWTTKEESGSVYTHKMASLLEKGDKFTKGAVLVYDEAFFEPDIFDLKTVVYKAGTTVNVALMEDIETFEDSCAIHNKTGKKLATRVTKVKSIVVNATDQIVDIVKAGTKVTPNSVMFTITDDSVAKLTGLSDNAVEALKRIKQASPKAKYKGVISKVIIYYNSPYEELSSTLKELADMSNKQVRKENPKFTTEVTSGYSIQGRKLMPGEVEIKIFIETDVRMGVGDKAIFANQLKTTVGDVYDYSMVDNNDSHVEAVFGFKSLSARIVTSPFIIGTTGKVLEILTTKAVEEYFGETE